MVKNNGIAQEMQRVGGHYAVTNRYRHPSLTSLVAGRDGKYAVFDLTKTIEVLQKTLSFIEECGKKGQIILFVSTRRETVDLVKKTAEGLSLPYMLNRWIGGTLSNFTHIKGRVTKMSTMQKEKEEGAWTKYTKKETVLFNRELAKLENRFTGIAEMHELPQAVFVLDTQRERIAVKEANNTNIPVIGFSNANADIHCIQHPIIANIYSRETVAYVLGLVEEAYKKGADAKEKGGNTKTVNDKNSSVAKKTAGTV